MGGRDGAWGREVALPGQGADEYFKALPADLGPEKREFTEALRAQFRACGLSLRAFGARYHHDHTTVWRYLNALHIPDRDFVEDVLAAVDAWVGAPVTAEVQGHLYALHLAALKATSRNRYDNRVLSDRLVAETLQVQAARRQEQALIEELAQSRARDQQLRMRLRELEAARDEDQIRHGAELVGYHVENERLRDELHRLRERISTLQLLLGQAQARRVQAEARCDHLEQSLAAIEQDVERGRREELRLAEERENRRREEERTLRAALAELERRSAAQEAEIAAQRRRFEAREAAEGGERQAIESMQVRPLLLEIWAAACAHTMRDGDWTWGDAVGSNSVSDAHQLLCFLTPATAVPELQLEDVSAMAPDVGAALAGFGGDAQIPRALIGALESYLERYTRPDGSSDFSGGSSLIPLDAARIPPDDLLDLDVVPSLTVSVRLCLAALGFLEEYVSFLPERSAGQSRAVKLRAALSQRLTDAMVGLLRGFTLNVIAPESDEGRRVMSLLNPDGLPQRQIMAMFADRMRAVRGRLGEARLGTAKAVEIEDPAMLFEIGWTWGIACDAPKIELDARDEQPRNQQAGSAESLPYLYFTMQATEAVEQLFSERAMALQVLSLVQERLANALRARRELTQMYWSRLARLGEPWPLEDIPWRTADGAESDYFSLQMCALLIQDVQQRNANQGDLRRLEPLLRRLADRARVTRRPLPDDPATALHIDGLLLALDTGGSLTSSAPFAWRANDFAPVLFKRTAQLAELTGDPIVRDKLLVLVAEIWSHLQNRQIMADYGKGIWDNPHGVFHSPQSTDGTVSWPLTSQIIDALVTAGSPPTW